MISELGALKVTNKNEWEKRIRRAMKRAQGRIPAAASELGVHWRTLYRWLDDATLSDVSRAAQGTRPGE